MPLGLLQKFKKKVKERLHNMNVNKKEFIQQLIDKQHYTKKAATTLVEDFLALVLENIEEGNTVSFRGFGCFDMLERAERSCKVPKTEEVCVIPAHWIPRFYAGKAMKRVVTKWEDNQKRGLV